MVLLLLGFLVFGSFVALDIPEASLEDEPIVWFESYEEPALVEDLDDLDRVQATEVPLLVAVAVTTVPRSGSEIPLSNSPGDDLRPDALASPESQSLPNRPIPGPPGVPLSSPEGVAQAEISKTLTSPETPLEVNRLVIPKMGLDAQVVEVDLDGGKWDLSSILHDVARLVQSPGQAVNNNVVLAGHVTLWSGEDGPFRWLHKLQMGDQVVIYDQGVPYTYAVKSLKAVKPSDVSVVSPTSETTLTLLTCTKWSKELRRYTMRLVVVATPVD